MKCLVCKNLTICEQVIVCPTTSHVPHLQGMCTNCPYPDAHGCYMKHQSIWINLLTYEEWVDGSSNTSTCINYQRSDLI
jgi:hypothetical protein